MRAAALVLALLAACSGPDDSTSTPDAGTPPPTADEACTKLSHSICARQGTCDAFGLQVRSGDAATCEARQKAACLNGLGAPGTGVSPTSTTECATALDSASCDVLLAGELPAECQPRPGTREAGAVCIAASQCKSAYCGIASGATCGTCMDAPGIGASCAIYACARGLTCARGLCVRPAVLSEPCDKDRPCDAGLVCVGSAQTGGHCEKVVATAGGTCDGKRQAAPDCDRRLGLFCVQAQCVRASFATANQACGAVNGAPVACLAGAECEIPDGAKQGTCAAPAADGAACDTAIGPPCLPLARCVPNAGGSTAGTCVFADAKTCP